MKKNGGKREYAGSARARAELRVSVKDTATGLSFDLFPDGRVELTLREEKDGKPAERTYKADSVEDFRSRYPGLAVHDIVVKIDGDPVTDRGEFRKAVKAKLATGFRLELLRKGKREVVEVKAAKQ